MKATALPKVIVTSLSICIDRQTAGPVDTQTEMLHFPLHDVQIMTCQINSIIKVISHYDTLRSKYNPHVAFNRSK